MTPPELAQAMRETVRATVPAGSPILLDRMDQIIDDASGSVDDLRMASTRLTKMVELFLGDPWTDRLSTALQRLLRMA